MLRIIRHYKLNINMFAALVILINALAPLSVAAKDLSGVEDLFGDKIIICTPTGIKYVSIDELNGLTSSDQDQSQSHCPLCLIKVSASVLYAINLSDAYEIEHRKSNGQVFSADHINRSASIIGAANPRAPPAFL
ncbi:DUF2946 domain-containing protein [Pseudemcibacter aquimaris]|uniref:DUF2946 domain-containing protein n=1 Tax=Pseudemcibacter aquimaris TaxID=2857064 RepID=UPI00201249CD|nr:DUF2946 domain-containing protein [Pseudemcibacter aquimaris]MCC3861658.1 DUF2946 domain-containing protein [Pseudemcibacter aquimaris]WDU58429.1 DUF2946 domain-containing protein [Pseudemcibacter aquimaris]